MERRDIVNQLLEMDIFSPDSANDWIQLRKTLPAGPFSKTLGPQQKAFEIAESKAMEFFNAGKAMASSCKGAIRAALKDGPKSLLEINATISNFTNSTVYQTLCFMVRSGEVFKPEKNLYVLSALAAQYEPKNRVNGAADLAWAFFQVPAHQDPSEGYRLQNIRHWGVATHQFRASLDALENELARLELYRVVDKHENDAGDAKYTYHHRGSLEEATNPDPRRNAHK